MSTDTQTATQISEETLAMLRKLYDRSKRADSHLDTPAARAAAEAEATQAAEMLGRLLDRYGLALSDMDSHGHSKQISHGHVGERTLDLGNSAFTWKVDLARAVAAHNMVQILEETKVRNKVTGLAFVGLSLHVETTMMLLDWLYGQIKSIGSAEYKEWRQAHPYEHMDPLRWHTSFGKGAGERIQERLWELRQSQTQAEAAGTSDGHTTALAVNIGTAVRDYLEERFPWRKESRLRTEQWEAGFQQRQRLLRIAPRAWQVWLNHQAPVIQVAAILAHCEWTDQNKRRMTAYEAEQEQRRQKQAKRDDAYYRRTGHYPGEGRRTKQVVDNTDYRAYDRGTAAAERINLQPHLSTGEAAAAEPAGSLR